MNTSKWLCVLGLAAVIGAGCGDDYGTPTPDAGPDGGGDAGKKGLDGGAVDGAAAAPEVGDKVDSILPGVDSAPLPLDANSGEPIATVDATTDGGGKDVASAPGVDASGPEVSIDGRPATGSDSLPSDAPLLNIPDGNTGLDGSIRLDSAPDGADLGEAGGTGILDGGNVVDGKLDALSS